MDTSNCTFSLFFQPVREIRRSAFEMEDRLKSDGYLTPFQIFPIPDEAPFELPRISATTENGHSTLTVSAQNAQVQSRYDDKFSNDPSECLDYSKKKAIGMLDALSAMNDIHIQFAGLSVQLLVPASEIGAAPIEFIGDTYLRVQSNLEATDAAVKLVYNVDTDFYLNLEVTKAVLPDPISINVSATGISVTQKISESEEMVSVSIDFNNRLAFNEGRAQGCSETTVDVLYSRMLAFLNAGLDTFLKEGVVRF